MKARQRKKNSRSVVDYQQNIAAAKKVGIKRPRLYLRVSNGLDPRIWAAKFGISSVDVGRSISKMMRGVSDAFRNLGHSIHERGK